MGGGGPLYGHLSEPIERRYNAASIFKRAQGQGHIARIEGLSNLLGDYGEWISAIDSSPSARLVVTG